MKAVPHTLMRRMSSNGLKWSHLFRAWSRRLISVKSYGERATRETLLRPGRVRWQQIVATGPSVGWLSAGWIVHSSLWRAATMAHLYPMRAVRALW